MLTLLNM